MIKQCSNCKHAYEKCHMQAKEWGNTLACNFWESDEPEKKEDKDKKNKGWF